MKRRAKVKRTKTSTIRFTESKESDKYDGKVLFPEKVEIANKVFSNLISFETLEEYEQHKKEQAEN